MLTLHTATLTLLNILILLLMKYGTVNCHRYHGLDYFCRCSGLFRYGISDAQILLLNSEHHRIQIL
jgi:hypothetical protein